MTSADLLRTSLLDLLFENRNKLYGAYPLRKYYNQRLSVSLAAAIGSVFLLACFVAAFKENTQGSFKNDPLIDDVIVHTQTMPPELPKPPALPKKPQPAMPSAAPDAQKQFTQIRITAVPALVTDVPAQTDLADAVIGSSSTPGVELGAVPAIAESGAVAPANNKTASTMPAYTEPQFPGGAAAWASFLNRNLQSPDALEAGEKKTVLVKFLVSSDGTVMGFDVVQSGGEAFDKEVMRVLKKMPKWKPALRYGQPVEVAFTQPVSFIAMGE